jgi:hypothetical protein
MVVAFVINGGESVDHCLRFDSSKSQADYAANIEWKKNTFIFDFDGRDSIAYALPLESTKDHATIRHQLQTVLDLARGVPSVDQRPNYGEILENLLKTRKLLAQVPGHELFENKMFKGNDLMENKFYHIIIN